MIPSDLILHTEQPVHISGSVRAVQRACHPLFIMQVPVLMLLENGPLRETADLYSQPWFKLYHFLSGWRPDVDMAGWAATAKSLAGVMVVLIATYTPSYCLGHGLVV